MRTAGFPQVPPDESMTTRHRASEHTIAPLYRAHNEKKETRLSFLFHVAGMGLEPMTFGL